MLLYGCSRGANFALRLAMREPERFSAIVAHVANSFERPTPAAANVLWVISNGEFDPGAPNAKRYYEQCRALGFPMFLRFFPGLGHHESPESLSFAKAFFDYALSAGAAEGNLALRIAAQSKAPRYAADLNNGLVFPVSKMDAVPSGQCVLLPNEDMARLWGRVIP